MKATLAAARTAKAIEETQEGQAQVLEVLTRLEAKIDRLIELAEKAPEKATKKGAQGEK